jgi:hypothetical protein
MQTIPSRLLALSDTVAASPTFNCQPAKAGNGAIDKGGTANGASKQSATQHTHAQTDMTFTLVDACWLYLALFLALVSCNLVNADRTCNLKCYNGGVCVKGEAAPTTLKQPFASQNSGNGMRCICADGWAGLRCDTKYAECGNGHACL